MRQIISNLENLMNFYYINFCKDTLSFKNQGKHRLENLFWKMYCILTRFGSFKTLLWLLVHSQ